MGLPTISGSGASKAVQDFGAASQKLIKGFQDALQQRPKDPPPKSPDKNPVMTEKTRESKLENDLCEKSIQNNQGLELEERLTLLKGRLNDMVKNGGSGSGPGQERAMRDYIKLLEKPSVMKTPQDLADYRELEAHTAKYVRGYATARYVELQGQGKGDTAEARRLSDLLVDFNQNDQRRKEMGRAIDCTVGV
jgi:hypothetical protein